MKLDLDCIRSVMLVLERELAFTDNGDILVPTCLTLEQICDLLPDFSRENVFYSIYNLKQAGYLNVSIQCTGGGGIYRCSVSDITYGGHEFLNKIRDEKRWEKVKGATGAIRDYSLSAIAAIAEGITNAAISRYFT